MSTFAVTIEKIATITPHPNADRLVLGTLEGMGYQFIIPKNVYEVGEKVVYFPVDSLLPEDIIERLELKGKLTGGSKNRVKTIKLRGSISQGIVAKTFMLGVDACELGEDVTALLGVEKYEPIEYFYNPAGSGKAGSRPEFLVPLPELVGKYDIESASKYSMVFNYLKQYPVVITEKLEGSHFALSYDGTEYGLYQRNFKIDTTKIENHLWESVARQEGLYEKIKIAYDAVKQLKNVQNDFLLTLRGELIGEGVQGNIYGLKGHTIGIFEVEVNGEPLNYEQFALVLSFANIKKVPSIYHGMLDEYLCGRTIEEASNGQSVMAPILREGIVIKPQQEVYVTGFGRLFLKQRSPEYLAKNDL